MKNQKNLFFCFGLYSFTHLFWPGNLEMKELFKAKWKKVRDANCEHGCATRAVKWASLLLRFNMKEMSVVRSYTE